MNKTVTVLTGMAILATAATAWAGPDWNVIERMRFYTSLTEQSAQRGQERRLHSKT